MVERDKCMGVSQLLGHVPGLPPESTPMNGNVAKLGVQRWINVYYVNIDQRLVFDSATNDTRTSRKGFLGMAAPLRVQEDC